LVVGIVMIVAMAKVLRGQNIRDYSHYFEPVENEYVAWNVVNVDDCDHLLLFDME
jgi:hypothetical protein